MLEILTTVYSKPQLEMLDPYTEIYGLITPGDWVDFFRYIHLRALDE